MDSMELVTRDRIITSVHVSCPFARPARQSQIQAAVRRLP